MSIAGGILATAISWFLYKISHITADKYDIMMHTEHDLVQPSRHSDLSYTNLAASTYVFIFSQEQLRDWNSLDTLSRSKFIPQPPVDTSCC